MFSAGAFPGRHVAGESISYRPLVLNDLREHYDNCATLRELLRGRTSENLRNLYWYDVPLLKAVSRRGMLRVARWNLLRRTRDEIASNYGLTNLYYAPPPGDGLHSSAA